MKKPLCLILRDGWSKGENEYSNALPTAKAPFTTFYESNYPTALLNANIGSSSAELEFEQRISNAYLMVGSGKMILPPLQYIDRTIADNTFFSNKILLQRCKMVKDKKAAMHLIGLMQTHGPHAKINHCIALLRMAKSCGVERVFIHAITDGHKVPPQSACEIITLVQHAIEETALGSIATVMGRHYAMDRTQSWENTKKAYMAIMYGEGKNVSSWKGALDDAYSVGQSDKFIEPRIISYDGADADDIFIFFNVRAERIRQLVEAFAEPDFNHFDNSLRPSKVMTLTHCYDKGNFEVIFPQLHNKNTFGEVISSRGLSQFRCADSERFSQLTFFFNGLRNEPFTNEERCLIDIPKDFPFDQKLELSAFRIRDCCIEAVRSGRYDVIICAFSNIATAAHTENSSATVKAVEVVDRCAHDLTETVVKNNGICILSATHGIIDYIDADPNLQKPIADSVVTFTVVGAPNIRLRSNGTLCDIAVTLLALLGIEKPQEMTGNSLII